MRYRQSEGELKQHLQEQIEFLLASSRAYDEGNKAEAKRLALHLRILLHDTSQSDSLLRQLGKKDIHFYDTMYGTHIVPEKSSDDRVMTRTGEMAATMIGGGEVLVLPKCAADDGDSFRGKNPFDVWWNAVIYLAADKPFTRRSLILDVANKDGGAHVSPTLKQDYADLTRHNLQGLAKVDKHGVDALDPPVSACIRQITFEVLKTLAEEYPEYLDNKPLVHRKKRETTMTISSVTLPIPLDP